MINAFVYKLYVAAWRHERAKNLTRDDQRVCLQIICSRVTSWKLKTSQEMINAFVYKLYVAAWRHES